MEEERDFSEYEILDYDAETDTYKIGINITDAEEEEIKTAYERYLSFKADKEEALSLEDFFEVMFKLGLKYKDLEIKEDFLILLTSEIDYLKKEIRDLKLKL